MRCPVTEAAASDATKLTACANARRVGAGTSACSSPGTTAGATVLTVTPRGASARAQLRIRPIWALLAVA
jgi:hypothetical protein